MYYMPQQHANKVRYLTFGAGIGCQR